jgi:hypothetical protein
MDGNVRDDVEKGRVRKVMVFCNFRRETFRNFFRLTLLFRSLSESEQGQGWLTEFFFAIIPKFSLSFLRFFLLFKVEIL